MSVAIYEVSVVLPISAKERAIKYMCERHIPHVLEHDAFSKAEFFVEEGEQFSFVTHYYVNDQSALERYTTGESKAQKDDFLAQLGEFNPQVARRLLTAPRSFAC